MSDDPAKNAGGAAVAENPPAANPPAPAADPKPAAPAAAAAPAPAADPAKPAPAAAAKPGEPAKAEAPKPLAPEKYELKAPEGVEVPADKLAAVEALARKLDLPNDKAQALLEHEVGAVQAHMASLVEAHQAKVVEWEAAVQADPEFGGAHMPATSEACKRALERFADPELREALDKSGYGNWPPLLRFVAKVGRAMAEDTFVKPNEPATKVDPLAAMYPTMK